jgi:hypothetical protein
MYLDRDRLPVSFFGVVIFLLQPFAFPIRAFLPPAIRERFSRQQEALVPPKGSPQFSCVTLRPTSG